MNQIETKQMLKQFLVFLIGKNGNGLTMIILKNAYLPGPYLILAIGTKFLQRKFHV
ncbi:MAG: hypothetical protein QOK71_03955 [Nitrososphaeraceae archaeon]|nr:hypothetical protein [Nitrososphaeraceae archaeon]